MNKQFFGIQPGQQRINSDIQSFRNAYRQYLSELVPSNADEIEKLSFKLKSLVKKKGFGAETEGMLLSIFEEPMVWFHAKTYAGTQKSRTVVARTARYEYIYRQKGNQPIKVFVGEQYFCSLTSDNNLIREDNRQVLLESTANSVSRRHSLNINKQLKAFFVYPETPTSVNPRAVEVMDNITDEELHLVLSLAIFRIIEYVISE